MESVYIIEHLKTIEIIGSIVLCLIIWSISYAPIFFRYILGIPISILTIYTIGLSCIPSYTQKPNIQDFFQTQKNKIVILSPNRAKDQYVQIESKNTNNKINIITGQQEKEIITEKSTIQYISPYTKNESQVFFTSKNGIVVQLFPQSKIEIHGIYPNKSEIHILKGNIASYIPKEESQTITFKIYSGQKEPLTNNPFSVIQKKEKEKFFKKQGGNPIIYTPISIYIQQFFLDTAQYIFPKIYTNKRTNFIAYKEIINQKNYIKSSVKTDTNEVNLEILNQSHRGRQETKIYQWINFFF